MLHHFASLTCGSTSRIHHNSNSVRPSCQRDGAFVFAKLCVSAVEKKFRARLKAFLGARAHVWLDDRRVAWIDDTKTKVIEVALGPDPRLDEALGRDHPVGPAPLLKTSDSGSVARPAMRDIQPQARRAVAIIADIHFRKRTRVGQWY